MEPNIFEIELNETKHLVRIVPLLKDDSQWSFQIEDLPPTLRFSMEHDESFNWFQTTGKDKIDKQTIDLIGNVVRKHYL